MIERSVKQLTKMPPRMRGYPLAPSPSTARTTSARPSWLAGQVAETATWMRKWFVETGDIRTNEAIIGELLGT